MIGAGGIRDVIQWPIGSIQDRVSKKWAKSRDGRCRKMIRDRSRRDFPSSNKNTRVDVL
jgi:hypothetical protein